MNFSQFSFGKGDGLWIENKASSEQIEMLLYVIELKLLIWNHSLITAAGLLVIYLTILFFLSWLLLDHEAQACA